MGFSKWIVGALGWAIFGPIGGILAFWLASRAEETAEIEEEALEALPLEQEVEEPKDTSRVGFLKGLGNVKIIVVF